MRGMGRCYRYISQLGETFYQNLSQYSFILYSLFFLILNFYLNFTLLDNYYPTPWFRPFIISYHFNENISENLKIGEIIRNINFFYVFT